MSTQPTRPGCPPRPSRCCQTQPCRELLPRCERMWGRRPLAHRICTASCHSISPRTSSHAALWACVITRSAAPRVLTSRVVKSLSHPPPRHATPYSSWIGQGAPTAADLHGRVKLHDLMIHVAESEPRVKSFFFRLGCGPEGSTARPRTASLFRAPRR